MELIVLNLIGNVTMPDSIYSFMAFGTHVII